MTLSQMHYSLLSDKKEHEKERNFQEAKETKSSQCSKHSVKQATVQFTPRHEWVGAGAGREKPGEGGPVA